MAFRIVLQRDLRMSAIPRSNIFLVKPLTMSSPYRKIDASGVAMSAIARGLPVLATAIDGFRELFDGGGGARLVPAEDPRALAAAIAEWAVNPSELDALRVHESWLAAIPSWTETARRHLEVYAQAQMGTARPSFIHHAQHPSAERSYVPV